VEETPGRLEYEVALFRETNNSPNPAARSSSPTTGTFITGVGSSDMPVDQAVPIGTRLQLRARISSDSGKDKIFFKIYQKIEVKCGNSAFV